MPTTVPSGSSTHKPTVAKEGYNKLEKALRKVLLDIANSKSRSNTQGWPEMAKTLRDVDEEKIKDTKEDIDTLLVFAGLFAAVLTPFLAETYQTLSQDPGDTSVAIQRHMSAQMSSYVFINGSLNSTVPAYSADDPSFILPPFALSINVLWFASLMLAVVTASFGILVKQWLREYMAIETSRSAKARLRVRQFRVTALNDWKVFDIAAILPLLLQFLLGLFFVGLCFFSWSVHPTIGWTITSIVSGWGVCFFFAIIAPAFSARCPYKTTLLKNTMRVLRGWICSSRITGHVYFGPVTKTGAPIEDGDAATNAKGNVQILTAADAILLDDDLLVTTMSDSLGEIQFSLNSVEVIDFVVAALQQRSPGSSPITRPIVSLDLRRLPKRTWTTLVTISARILKCNRLLRSQSANDLDDWEKDAIMILSTFYPSTLISEAGDALTLCMTAALIPTCQLIGSAQNLLIGHKSLDSDRSKNLRPHRWLLHILELLRGQLSRSDIALPVKDELQTIFGLVVAIPDLCNNACDHDSSRLDLGKLLSAHADRLQKSVISIIGQILIDHRNRFPASARESDPLYGDYESLTIAAGGALKNDDFLHDALPAALNHNNATPADSMKLILGVIRNRQKQDIPLYGATCLLELKDISEDAWTTIMDATARLLNDALESPQCSYASYTDWEVWMKDAVLVLLSISEHSMTEEAAGKCLDLLGSQPNRSAIETFTNLKVMSSLCGCTYELKDLIRALKACIPKDRVSQYPILNALP
ncbi:hypothetical protein EW026_g5635 [Hermanssonia centrifuga]|uniref:DUF6535 domain-containing protein n=1 Tax=Hermanssonia centrifuga TaxID=98765 RepID=A0A4S4KDR6_9APHY|nr:hypothetical protein EW026_g5635 [Hermanssonia centrifuga]